MQNSDHFRHASMCWNSPTGDNTEYIRMGIIIKLRGDKNGQHYADDISKFIMWIKIGFIFMKFVID